MGNNNIIPIDNDDDDVFYTVEIPIKDDDIITLIYS